ncbi:hypothetical protein DIPPA_55842, partial [Diplonema papillatum]
MPGAPKICLFCNQKRKKRSKWSTATHLEIEPQQSVPSVRFYWFCHRISVPTSRCHVTEISVPASPCHVTEYLYLHHDVMFDVFVWGGRRFAVSIALRLQYHPPTQ